MVWVQPTQKEPTAMGVTRKMMSMSTIGLIDFRSDKERIARSTRLTHHELRRQTRIMTHTTQRENIQRANDAQSDRVDRIVAKEIAWGDTPLAERPLRSMSLPQAWTSRRWVRLTILIGAVPAFVLLCLMPALFLVAIPAIVVAVVSIVTRGQVAPQVQAARELEARMAAEREQARAESHLLPEDREWFKAHEV